ncbi:MAG: DUF2341 domain-containing protein, partial [Verrucomicrobiota bacterium]
MSRMTSLFLGAAVLLSASRGFAGPGPGIQQTGATNLMTGVADLTGELCDTNGVVTVYWGPVDGGTDPAEWAFSRSLGSLPTGPFSTTVGDLLLGLPYYYRTFASNIAWTAWAPSTTPFKTAYRPPPGRARVTFCGFGGQGTLSDIPLLIQLGPHLPDFTYADFIRPDGYDLRIYDGMNGDPLNYEIDTWDVSGTSLIWVKVPTLNSPTNSVRLRWSNPAFTNQPAYTTNGAVWSAGYAGVWHFNQAAGSVLDATHQAQPGVPAGDAALDPNGFLGSAAVFDGTGDRYVVPDFNHVNGSTQLTISAWSYLNTLGVNGDADGSIFSKGLAAEGPFFFLYDFDTGIPRAGNSNHKRTYNFSVGNSGGGSRIQYLHNAAMAQQWQYVVGVMDHTYRGAWLDGTLRIESTSANDTNVLNILGEAWIGGWIQNAKADFDGRIDELRIATVARSSNWNRTVWLNMASNAAFNCVDLDEEAVQPIILELREPHNVTTGSATLNSWLNASGAVYHATVFWGQTDGGTNPAA